jgi:hypothetical protein
MTLHTSGPNCSGDRRRGYATHYMRASSVILGDKVAVKGNTVDGKASREFRQVRGATVRGANRV